MTPFDFREIFERMPLPAHVETEDGTLAAVNGRWRELAGAGSRECCGCPVSTFLPDGDAGGGFLRCDGTRLAVDRQRTPLAEGGILVTLAPRTPPGDEAALDRQEALRAGHLASLGEIAAGVAHEINNPINGIINYAQLLHDHLAQEGDEQAQVAERIMREGRRISKIVRTLLGFARVAGDLPVPGTLERELEAVLSLSRAQMRKENIRLEVRIADPLPVVSLNPNRMQQVILNLIHNARHALNQKFPDRDDRKILTISLAPLRDERLWLRLTIRDEGVGIPPELRQRIFEPFFTTKPTGLGTGLGLSISRDIVAGHEGRIVIESEVGSYTAAHVDLPSMEIER